MHGTKAMGHKKFWDLKIMNHQSMNKIFPFEKKCIRKLLSAQLSFFFFFFLFPGKTLSSQLTSSRLPRAQKEHLPKPIYDYGEMMIKHKKLEFI